MRQPTSFPGGSEAVSAPCVTRILWRFEKDPTRSVPPPLLFCFWFIFETSVELSVRTTDVAQFQGKPERLIGDGWKRGE